VGLVVGLVVGVFSFFAFGSTSTSFGIGVVVIVAGVVVVDDSFPNMASFPSAFVNTSFGSSLHFPPSASFRFPSSFTFAGFSASAFVICTNSGLDGGLGSGFGGSAEGGFISGSVFSVFSVFSGTWGLASVDDCCGCCFGLFDSISLFSGL